MIAQIQSILLIIFLIFSQREIQYKSSKLVWAIRAYNKKSYCIIQKIYNSMSKPNDKYLMYGSEITFKMSKTNSYISSTSFLRKELNFKHQFINESSNSALFIIEPENNIAQSFIGYVNYHEFFYLKHYNTNKYVGLAFEAKETPSDTTYQLQLKSDDNQKCLFRIQQCYIYQKKISNHIRYDQQIYLIARLRNNKEVFLTVEKLGDQNRVVSGYNSKVGITIQYFFQKRNVDIEHYCFNDHVYISHTQIESYLNYAEVKLRIKNYPKELEQKGQFLEYENFTADDDPSIRGIWILEGENPDHGGKILNEERFRLKNLFYGKYLALITKPPNGQNSKQFNPITLQNQPEQNTLFRATTLNGKDNFIKHNNYFILQHILSSGFLSTTTLTYKKGQEQEVAKIYLPHYQLVFNPADVYKFQKLGDHRIRLINLAICLQKDLMSFDTLINMQKQKLNMIVPELINLYNSLELTLNQLNRLQVEQPEEFSYSQKIFNPLIKWFVLLLRTIEESIKQDNKIEGLKMRVLLLKITKKCFSIMIKMTIKNIENKTELYKYLVIYISFVCLEVEAEELMIEIFKNTKSLMVKIDAPLNQQNQTLLFIYLRELKNASEKTTTRFYNNVRKFIKLCISFMVYDDICMSYNQTYISQLLFDKKNYKHIMFNFKVQNDRVKIYTYSWKDIEDIKEVDLEFALVVDQLNLFSCMCRNRNYIAKAQLTELFSCNTLINYIQMPISEDLKRIFFKLITYIYVDSNPRNARIIPFKVLAISLEQEEQFMIKQQDDMNSQLHQKLMETNSVKFKVSQKKLNLSNMLKEDEEEIFMQTEELDLYRMILLDRIDEQIFQPEMFETLEKLIELECYSYEQIGQIFFKLSQKLDKCRKEDGHKIYRLINLLNKLILQLEFERLISLSKLIHERNHKDMSESEINQQIKKFRDMLLPNQEQLQIKQIFNTRAELKNQMHIHLIEEYNKNIKFIKLQGFYKKYLMNQFFDNNDEITNQNKMHSIYNKYEKMKVLYQLIQAFFFHKKHYLQHFNGCLIINQTNDIELANYLYNQYKKLTKLNESTQVWLFQTNQKDKHKLKSFCVILRDIISFFYEDHKIIHSRDSQEERSIREFSDQSKKKLVARTVQNPDVSLKRQVLIRNIGFHKIIFLFLEECLYIMDRVKQNEVVLKPFFYCFQFLHAFILKDNQQNKNLLENIIDLLFVYLQKAQIGQSLLISELYKNNNELCRRVNNKIMNSIIDKIILRGETKKISEGNYNSTLITFLQNITIMGYNQKPQLTNLEKLIKYLNNSFIFKKMFFLKQVKNMTNIKNQNKNDTKELQQSVVSYQFNLEIKDILLDQIPYIYHYKILKMVNLVIVNFKEKNETIIKNLINTLDFNYLLSILSRSDNFTKLGIRAKLFFLCKIQIAKLLLSVYIYNESDMKKLKNNETLKKFYQKLKDQISRYRNKTKSSPKDKSLDTLLQKYQPYILQYEAQFQISYKRFLTQYILPLLKQFKGKLERYKESENYLKNDMVEKEIQDLITTESEIQVSKQQRILKKMQEDFSYIHSLIFFPLKSVFLKDNDNEQNVPSSQVQRFSNRLYIGLQLNQSIKERLKEQQVKFIEKLCEEKEIKKYLSSLINFMDLIIIKMQSLEIEQINTKTDLTVLNEICEFLQKVILNQKKQEKTMEIIQFYLKNKIITKFFNFIVSANFQIMYPAQNLLFYSFLNLTNHMIRYKNNQIIQEIVVIITNNPSCFKIFVELKDIIVEVSNNQPVEIIDKINQSFQKISNQLYTFEMNNKSKNEKFEIGLKFLNNLCINADLFLFTEFLRKQKNYRITIDFLPILVNSAYYLIFGRKGTNINLNLNKSCILELLLNAIQELMYGPSQKNQQFLLETRFNTIILQVIKISETANKKQSGQSQVKIQELIMALLKKQSNTLTQSLTFYLTRYEINHQLFLNRIKYRILQCITNSILGNEVTLNRLMIFLPEEYLKVNLIWIFNQFKSQNKLKFSKQLLEFQSIDQRKLIKDPTSYDSLVLLNGFKLFELISQYEDHENKNNDDETNQDPNEKEKDEKLKIVKKFFKSLKSDQVYNELQENIKNTKYYNEIKMYKKNYKEAIFFFQEKTCNIEISFKKQLYKVYFPKLPLCQFYNIQLREQFRKQANRVSQSSKHNSLISFSRKIINFLVVQESFVSVVSSIHPNLLHIVNFDYIMTFSLVISYSMIILVFLQLQKPQLVTSFVEPQSSNLVGYYIELLLQFILLFIGLLLLIILVVKEIPLSIRLANLQISQNQDQQQEQGCFYKFKIYLSYIFNAKNLYLIYLIIFHSAVIFNSSFNAFLLLELFRRMDTAKVIIRAVIQTRQQLAIGVFMFIAFNYVYAFINFITYFRDATYSQDYAPCSSLYNCFLFLNDAFFQGDSGYFSLLPFDSKNYNDVIFNPKSLIDITYIIFVCKVIKDIFSGTIIDKFSELREAKQAIQEDEESRCFICGMERYELDFQLEGFQQHKEQTHNPQSYIFYIFYLMKKKKDDFNRLEKYVWFEIENNKESWFPSGNSLFKIKKEKIKSEKEEINQQNKVNDTQIQKQYRQKLLKEMKKKTESIIIELKNSGFQSRGGEKPIQNKK